MIRTRQPDVDVFGDGDVLIAVTEQQLELIAALIGMCKLGTRPYQEAAYELLEVFEEITGDQDFCTSALLTVMPVLEVHDPDTYDIIATYDDDHIFEFVV